MKPISRREFLQRAATISAYACCAAAFGITGPQIVFGQTSGGNGNLLILFNQFGGNDPLNSFSIPFGIDRYYDIRPTIGIPEASVLQVNNVFGLHPALANLHRLYLAGNVAILYGVGEPVGTRSHFTSQDIMSLGVSSNTKGEKRGWIGRLGDRYFRNDQFNTFALGVGQKLDFSAERVENSTLVLPNLSSYSFLGDSKTNVPQVGLDSDLQQDLVQNMMTQNKSVSGTKGTARRSIASAHRNADRIQRIVTDFPPTATYPATKAGEYFKDASILARSSLGAKLCYGGMGGWDNHADQGGATGTQAGLLSQMDAAIAAFEQDMKSASLWSKISICIFTEFGRTIAQNTSNGTDHGWGSVMMLIGGNVKGGVYGTGPTLTDLTQERWLLPQIDYRNPFREMVEWMGYDADPIFTDSYSRMNLGLYR